MDGTVMSHDHSASAPAEQLDLVITNAKIRSDDDALYNIGIKGGVIVAMSSNVQDLGHATETTDAAGRWVIPGAIDSHAHINQRADEYNHIPGLGPDDNFSAESRGALAGGCTTALNYVQFGTPSLLDSFHDGLAAARAQSQINVMFHGCLMNMGQVSEIEQATKEGMRTFKIFMPYRGEEAKNLGGIGSLNHAQMREAFAAIVANGAQALVHAEDGDIVDAAMQTESTAGLDSLAGWERSRPTIAEGDAAWTALYLAEEAGCQVSIVHVSSLEAIKARKALGYPGAALESCVHYMVLSTESAIGPEGKVAPPIRDRSLSDAITEAVLAGEIDFFGSDHNEWPSAAKTDWETSKPGLPGIGLMLPLLLTHLVVDNGMSMESLIELTSRNAAVRFGLEGKGKVAIGMDADLVILEEGERVVRIEDLHSPIDYSPYAGMTLRMWPSVTVCGGVVVFADGEFPREDFRGEMLNDRFRTDPALAV
ncbi:amidohydrolase family protein [Salinibacterium sp. NSLL150]|uniref:dihydroorotase n=2 Tax=unclassified Salinibacterium TaxID=2632331 RepID=UPI0018CE6EE2|nr:MULTISPECIES: amidohydrolase family protein [unclassified Salinibacterium]MBH0104334.1 amidohydrolase family protein [Salinibacterium sp. NSLL16]MBH0023847.1 amidohydrolase family protein [Salinibacterium sp. SWN248]MBH0098820.1 amidohydrolase family protein [Salinibacterium sp. NSLL35]MBH0101575.1 amidohydrolase family protein [Salinibacterium sp. NSLL150]MBH0107095.1 amidohydrolase family protein [Salinibacterium sp. NSLL17]